MAHYSGISLTAYWGANIGAAIELLGHGRTFDITETAPAPDSIDVTHKADTARSIVTGLPGGVATNVSMTALVDDTWSLMDTMPLNTQATLWLYPQGKTAGKQEFIVQPVRLHERTYKEAFDGTIELTLTFNSKNTCLHTTCA